MNGKEVEEVEYKNFFPNVVPATDDENLQKMEFRGKGKYYFDRYHGDQNNFHCQIFNNIK